MLTQTTRGVSQLPKVKDRTNAERQRRFQAKRRQGENDRAQLMAAFSAAAPETIGEHIRLSVTLEDSEPRLVWDLDEIGAAFVNDFAASLGKPGRSGDLLAALSLHIGKKLSRGGYDWQKGG